jgi:hypothetical protein
MPVAAGEALERYTEAIEIAVVMAAAGFRVGDGSGNLPRRKKWGMRQVVAGLS